jgi:predicted DNA-binding transcriptional regulator YafY
MAAFKQGINRVLKKLIEKHAPYIVTKPFINKKFGNEYHWLNEDAKDRVVGIETENTDEIEAKVTIFKFIDSYLSEFLPPQMLRAIEEDIKSASTTKNSFSKWDGKLRFLPPNLEQTEKRQNHAGYLQQSEAIFNALKDEKVIRASYSSIHEGDIPKRVTLSPQRIEYHDQKVILLAYVHEKQKYKSFHFYRLKNIEQVSGVKFQPIHWSEYYTEHHLELRVADWVAESLLRSNFGVNLHRMDSKDTNEIETRRVVTLRGEVRLPKHFSKDGPDTFDCINYLSRYGDALNIIQPAFLREEMARRVRNMHVLYTEDNPREHARVLLKSAYEQTNNTEMAEQIDKRLK